MKINYWILLLEKDFSGKNSKITCREYFSRFEKVWWHSNSHMTFLFNNNMKEMDRDSEPRSIVLYDGFCNLCSNTALIFFKLDRKRKFTFIALQSVAGKEMLKKIQHSGSSVDSVMLLKGDDIFIKSKAIFEIIRKTGGILRFLLIFRILPDRINDYFYDLVARNRFFIFGKKKECFIIEWGYITYSHCF